MRRRAALVLFTVGAAFTLAILGAAVIGGVGQYPGFSITTSKSLRVGLIAFFAGWLVLPEGERQRLTARVEPHRRRLLLGALAFALSWAVAYKLSRWLALRNGAYDMSLFESTLLNTLRGNFMYCWGLERSLFSEHFEPVVLLMLPLYAVSKSALALQLPQAFAITLAVVPLYRLSRTVGLAPHLSVLVGAAYLLNANLHQSNLMDFHPELFAPLAVFWALHASLERRWLSLYLALAFALSLKEEMALVMLCFSVLVLRGEGGRRWPHALAVAALAFAWGVFTFKVAMPMAHPEQATFHPLANRWAHLGATYPQMALGLISRPGYVIGLFTQWAPLQLLLSLGAVPLLDPLGLLVAVPPLLGHLSSDYDIANRLGAYYGLFGNVFLIAAVPFALLRLQRRGLALYAAMAMVAAAPTVPFFAPIRAADLRAASAIAAIDPGARVCAQSSLAPHRAPDERLRMAPDCGGDPDWVLLATAHDWWPMQPAEHQALIAAWRARGDYRVAFSEGDYLFFARTAVSASE